jgi:hypothetical protein
MGKSICQRRRRRRKRTIAGVVRRTYNSGVSSAASTTCSSLFTSIRYDILAPTKLENVLSEIAEKDILPASCVDRFVKYAQLGQQDETRIVAAISGPTLFSRQLPGP